MDNWNLIFELEELEMSNVEKKKMIKKVLNNENLAQN